MSEIDRKFGYRWSIFPDAHDYGYLGRGGQEKIVVVFTGALEVDREGIL